MRWRETFPLTITWVNGQPVLSWSCSFRMSASGSEVDFNLSRASRTGRGFAIIAARGHVRFSWHADRFARQAFLEIPITDTHLPPFPTTDAGALFQKMGLTARSASRLEVRSVGSPGWRFRYSAGRIPG